MNNSNARIGLVTVLSEPLALQSMHWAGSEGDRQEADFHMQADCTVIGYVIDTGTGPQRVLFRHAKRVLAGDTLRIVYDEFDHVKIAAFVVALPHPKERACIEFTLAEASGSVLPNAERVHLCAVQARNGLWFVGYAVDKTGVDPDSARAKARAIAREQMHVATL